MKVAIVDYRMGNVESVSKAIHFLGHQPIITSDANVIESCDYVILPGVGAFAQGMSNLKSLGLIDILNEIVVIKKKPFLGICLGMQLLASKGFEPTETQGLGWISGNVVKMVEPNLQIPHLGWNEVLINNSLLLSSFNNKDFYFIHSYHFVVDDPNHVVGYVKYGNQYAAIIQRDNIHATQFHPEKSQKVGLELLKTYLGHYA